jgi:hypothetical protein
MILLDVLKIQKIILELERTQVIVHLAVLSTSKIPKPLFSVSVHTAK